MGTPILEELFESGDGPFLEELRRTNLGKKGGAFAERWYRDSRPRARPDVGAELRQRFDACKKDSV